MDKLVMDYVQLQLQLIKIVIRFSKIFNKVFFIKLNQVLLKVLQPTTALR